MPRASNQIDQALLASGVALYPDAGYAGLSVRALAEHAGANQGMFHYHFKTKDNFIAALLQQFYESMFSKLQAAAAHEGPPLVRLRATLAALARFARDHRRVLARLWMDAMAGEAVVLEFVKRNAPRHIGLIAELLRAAQAEGALAAQPPVQRLMFVAGAVMLPMIFAAGALDAAAPPAQLRAAFDAQVMSDAALEQRIDWALAALGVSAATTPRAASARQRRGGTR